MFSYVYRQFSWPCHPIRTNNSTGNVIQFVSTTQLAIKSWLYQPLYWVGHPICTDHSNGHVILSVLTPLTGHVILSLPTTYGPCHPICINHSSDHIILSVPGLHKIIFFHCMNLQQKEQDLIMCTEMFFLFTHFSLGEEAICIGILSSLT